MTANNGTADSQTWPMPKFRFEVEFGDGFGHVAFQEVSGLDVEASVIDYRNSNSREFAPIKMPGLKKYGNVTLKGGVFVNDNTFWDLHTAINMGTVKRRTVVIKLLDENGSIAMQWTLMNAWPTRITSTDLKSDGNEVAVDTMELAHEGLTVYTGG
ncbi:phage tail protein [Mucilaginibacter conchicola]|uniref:Phage tail protein n=1 Tax=Mucilaginibacter conchicola TaxID=2303333 RepID=A0A372NTZ9_9SPHI|nr:phage tail protein [Mucilaginibacter conchicola]RFZ92738.1 phage tail protein [Mucilaginibacter conchicola]